ncbi:hypothetical protein PRIPAC_89565, partial [Pristionchus pacificus]|uniref:Trpa-2 n=1 Tax=Pristionchus pacificus TaxID=54126 RepID=A0A2A6B937_PRIPA
VLSSFRFLLILNRQNRMVEEQQLLTALNMEDDDENLSYISSNSSVYKTPPQSTSLTDLSSERLLNRLASRGIHCPSKPSRAALIAHLRKHHDSFKPTLKWLHANGLVDEHETRKLDDRDRAKDIDDADGWSPITPKKDDPLKLLIDGDLVERYCINFYNRRTRKIINERDRGTIYLFDYRSSEADRVLAPFFDRPFITFHDVDGECINWRHLKDLKTMRGFWNIIRHPMVLNFINERKNMFNDVLITTFVGFFLFVMILKIIAAIAYKSINFWSEKTICNELQGSKFISRFVSGCAFHTITFAATLTHVWLPYLIEYESWALPFFALISTWINFLYILRKGPTGIYIIMMARLLKSFGHIATIWIPAMFAFSFVFQLVMKDSGVEPWSDVVQNATAQEKIFVVLQAFTKMSTMMIGETSIAVGDVNDLRKESNNVVLGIKYNFVIESLQLAEAISLPFFSKIRVNPTNNVLVQQHDGYSAGHVFAAMVEDSVDKVFDDIPEYTSKDSKAIRPEDNTSLVRMAKKWLIGLDWSSYLE